MTAVVVRNEEDAWSLLRRIFDEGDNFQRSFTFKGWPVLTIKVEPGDGRGTPEIVRAVDRLQRHVYCVFAFLKYGSPDTRRLTRRDRHSVALKHSIKSGSTVLGIDASDAFREFAREAGKEFGRTLANRMKPRHLASMVLIGSLAIASVPMWGAWLNHKADVLRIEENKHRAQMQMDSQREFIGLMSKLAEQHTQQLALINSVVERSDLARYATADYIPWRPALLELATAGTVITINHSVKIAAGPAKTIAKVATKVARAERKQLAKTKSPPVIGDWRTTTIAEPATSQRPQPPMRLGRTVST